MSAPAPNEGRIACLRALPASIRLALTLLLLVNAGGFAASALHLRNHHENRDERPGLSLDDLEGAYHGIRAGSPLVLALNSGHPTDLPAEDRTELLTWLASNKISETYDDLDLGDRAPAELIATQCLDCHSRQSDNQIALSWPLDYWDDIERIAVSREVRPVDTAILAASTHTHAISLAGITLLLGALFFATRYAEWLRGGLILLASAGLATDLAAWWLARESAGFVWAIVAGGAAYAGTMVLMSILIVVDLWRPVTR